MATGPKIAAGESIGADQWVWSGLWVQVESSNVKGIRYEQDARTLYVEFKARSNKGGRRYSESLYRYDGVPHHVARAMFLSASMGRFVHYRLNGKYPHQKIR